jgi:hypothetical protein
MWVALRSAGGVPVLVHGPPASTYTAAATLYELLGRFGRYYKRPTFTEQAIHRGGEFDAHSSKPFMASIT